MGEVEKTVVTLWGPNGVIVVHISNRLFDLEPVLAAAAKRLGWAGAVGARDAAEPGATDSRWAVISADHDVVDRLVTIDGWRALDLQNTVDWTDDYSSMLSVLR